MRVISLQLRRAYEASTLTQEEIAARSGVAENTVHGVLSGKRNATIDNVCAIAQVLGVSALSLAPTDCADTK